MKITTDYAGPLRLQLQRLRLGLGLAAAALTLGLGTLVIQGHRAGSEKAELLAELGRYRGMSQSAETAPAREALEEVKRRVEALRQVAAPRGLPIRTRIALLEAQLPDPVWLVKLHHEARSGVLELIAESTDIEALSTLLLRLEKSGDYSKVLLTRQTQRDQGGRRYRRFEIRLETP